MKIPGIALICWFFVLMSPAQEVPIGAMRFNDNNHELATDSCDWKIHRAIKEITPGRQNSSLLLSFGGEIREQLRYYQNIYFGEVPEGMSTGDFYLQQRYMLHADLRLGSFIRLFGQMNSCHITGANIVSPQVDRDDLGIMQAFADINLKPPVPLQIRLGRQEIMLGAERILGLREGPTVRQSFDGGRLTLELPAFTGTILLVQPVLYNVGVFDNTRRKNEFVLAGYGSVPLKKKNLVDLYYFWAGFQHANYANEVEDEVRHSTGIRLTKNKGAFLYDAEFTWQFGLFGDQDIRAWHLSSLVAYRWQDVICRPRFLLRESLYSGDRKHDDGIMNTFRPVSTKSPVHDMSNLGAANLALLSPELELVLSTRLAFTLRYLFTWRMSGNDGIYPPGVRSMIRPTDMPGNELGKPIFHGFAAELMVTPNKHIVIWIFGGLLRADSYIRNTGGEDMQGYSIRAAYKF
jgi:hypothetical protein